ncbi:hypothetical protein [Methylorubrum thiocyanatum]|uniref:hypothetical protein n=1 Tax=Methylorubrum thiocyanatum TaxID=47958 RepID=UPI003651ECB5
MSDLINYGNVVAGLSLAAAASAIFLCFKNQKGAAAIMGGLFVTMAIISQLQSFKSFKAFTVEAQLQDKIDRADELIKQLRELSILVAKAGYGSTGISMLALGGLQTSELTLTKDFDSLLDRLRLSRVEMLDARRPLLRVVALKLVAYMAATSSAIMVLKADNDALGKDLSAPEFGMTAQMLQEKVLTIDTPEKLKSVLELSLPAGMSSTQRAAADRFIGRLVKVYEGCRDHVGLTAEFLTIDRLASSSAGDADMAKAIFEGRVLD